jgi:hypothetical protein
VGRTELSEPELRPGEADYSGRFNRAFVCGLFAGDFAEALSGGFCDDDSGELLFEFG